MTSPCDPSWHNYPNTVLEFYFDGLFCIDLRQPLTDTQRLRLEETGLGSTFAVITASNPRGHRTDSAENHLRNEALQAEVAASDTAFLRADGVSVDGTHRETGIAVALPQDQAHRLALRYEQSALFWFDGSDFWILPVLETGAQPLRLP